MYGQDRTFPPHATAAADVASCTVKAANNVFDSLKAASNRVSGVRNALYALTETLGVVPPPSQAQKTAETGRHGVLPFLEDAGRQMHADLNEIDDLLDAIRRAF